LTILLAAHPIVHVNASLNALATVLLIAGLLFIKIGRIDAHKWTMLSAFGVSSAFLVCYIWYHLQVGSVRFTHPGVVRYVYLAILASHVLLAVTVPFLAIRQIYLGYRALGCCGDCPLFAAEHVKLLADTGKKGTDPLTALYREKHCRLARWVFPIWLYVSVTGVVVYVMLYHLWPPAGQ
jgi:putative membrane protein